MNWTTMLSGFLICLETGATIGTTWDHNLKRYVVRHWDGTGSAPVVLSESESSADNQRAFNLLKERLL